MDKYEPQPDVETDGYEEFEDFDIEDYMEEDDLTYELDFNVDEEYRGEPTETRSN
jgi:hypothetical protein